MPNGFGQISEIKGRNLRNPFRAMITVGKTETGRPICELLKPIAYFRTYNEAYAALLEYNKNPYDLEKSITVKELYEKWFKEYSKTVKSVSGIRNITASWNYCSSVYDMRVADLRARHIKDCMNNGTYTFKGRERSPSAHMQSRIKSFFNLMLDYAVEYEIVDRNYARSFNISDDLIKEVKEVKNEHMAFTDEEIDALWKNIDDIPYIDIILIQCYSGWRPKELGLLKISDVDLNNWTFKGGVKTEAGIDRIVPIHSKIRKYVRRKYDEALSLGSNFLFNCTDDNKGNLKLTYWKYKKNFDKIMTRLNLNTGHRTHDPRKHFVTMAKKCNMDEYAIKYIVGHAISDITERIYTEREINWLREEIEKIK